jgi:hypothetical protein
MAQTLFLAHCRHGAGDGDGDGVKRGSKVRCSDAEVGKDGSHGVECLAELGSRVDEVSTFHESAVEFGDGDRRRWYVVSAVGDRVVSADARSTACALKASTCRARAGASMARNRELRRP